MIFTVYSMYDRLGFALYIGCSGNWPTRLNNHSKRTWFPDVVKVTLVHYPSQREALEAEWIAIDKKKPMYNLDTSIDGRHYANRGKRLSPEEILEDMRREA